MNIDTSAALHQGRVLDRHRGSSESRLQNTLRQVEGQELSAVVVAAKNNAFPFPGEAYIFQVVLVLVGPEAVDIIICLSGTEDGTSHRTTLLFSVVNAPPALFQRPGAAGAPSPAA